MGGVEYCRALKSEMKLQYLYALVISFADYYRGNRVMQLINMRSSVSNTENGYIAVQRSNVNLMREEKLYSDHF